MCANDGISAATKALNVGAAELPEAAPANTWFVVLTVSVSKNFPLPPIALIVVADPPDPPVPIPINRVLLPSLNANSAFSSVVGADEWGKQMEEMLTEMTAQLKALGYIK